MAALVPPPDAHTPVDSWSFRDWFNRVWQWVLTAARLGDEQTFTSKNHFTSSVDVKGPWPASMVVIQDNALVPGGAPWAVVGESISRATLPTGVPAVGGFFSAKLGQGGGLGWGIATEAWTGTETNGSATPTGGLAGAEVSIISQNDNQVALMTGINAVFKNRPDGATAPFNGLGTNKYNFNSIAFWITSQPRSSAGEYCGWTYGIVFDAGSLDRNTGGAGLAPAMHPRDTTRTQVGVWLPSNMPIMHDSGGGIATKYNSASGHWQVAVGGVEKLGVDTSSGELFIGGPTTTSAPGAGGAGALPATPSGYVTVNIAGIGDVQIPYY